MKKKIWIVSPISIVVSSLLFVMAFLGLKQNFYIFVIEISVSLCAFAFSFIEIYNFNNYLKATARNIKHKINETGEELERLSFPAVVVGEHNDIVFCNNRFVAQLSAGRNCIGQSIEQYLIPKRLSDIINIGGADVVYAGRSYTTFVIPLERSLLVCFLDDTYYKEAILEYTESRPAVCMIVFDNKEEIINGAFDEYDEQAIINVEHALQNWAKTTSGFLKKLDGNRYMMIVEDRHVKVFIEQKFNILETIKTIKTNKKQCATVSIGIGRNAPNFHEGERWAQKALIMALGRGGDQVTIKQGDSYSFFGGKSKGIEKSDKVRTRVIASTLTDYIKNADNVLIMGHKFSDLDSVGAAVGLWGAITKTLGKSAYIVLAEEHSLAVSIINMVKDVANKEVFISPSKASEIVMSDTLLIIVDTHSEKFVEDNDLYNMCKKVAVIDHHRMMVDHIQNAVVFYHEPYASSASEMVTEIIQYFGENVIGSIEAEALLAGIMLDTKNFVMKTGVRTFEAAAFLKRKGADTIEVKKLFSNSIETYKEKSQLVSTAEIINGCAITFAQDNTSDIRTACAQAADELLTIRGVKSSFVMYPSTNDMINISARSLGDVNVQIVMEEMGGGGHLTMAGAQVESDDIQAVKSKLISILEAKK